MRAPSQKAILQIKRVAKRKSFHSSTSCLETQWEVITPRASAAKNMRMKVIAESGKGQLRSHIRILDSLELVREPPDSKLLFE